MPDTITSLVVEETFVGNNSTVTPYPLTIEYASASHIKLLVDGVTEAGYTVANDGLRTNVAVPNTSTLTVYRETPKNQLVTFPANSTPSASDVAAALNKLTLISQEPPDLASADISDITAAGIALITAANAAAQRTALGLVIGTNVQAYSAVLAATTASFTTADETKLDGIEALADVTDTANVTAAGALMDSEVTNLAAVKAFDPANYEAAGAIATHAGATDPHGDRAYADAQIAAAVTGLLDFKGSTDCSANPNYPSASKGDAYYVSVAGKIGGASGKTVEVGDVFVASADNAGGAEGSVGTSWFVLEHNLVGALVASNNLSDLTNAANARSNLGLGTAATTSASAYATAAQGITADSAVQPSSTNTLTNKRITARITTIVSDATPTINTDNCDAVTITALAAAITSMTSNLTGTPNNFDMLMFRIKDNGTARAITWGASFEAKGAALPTTTVISKVLHALFIWDSVTSQWGCISTSQEA